MDTSWLVFEIAIAMSGLIGALLLRSWFRARRLGIQSQSWPAVEGIISSSKLEERMDGDGRHYSPVIVYEYDLGGIHYTSSRITFTDKAPLVDIKRYPEAKKVSVRYNPENPQESAIEPGFRGDQKSRLLLGLFFLGLAVVLIIAALSFVLS